MRASGRTTKMIKELPLMEDIEDKIYVVGHNHDMARYIRSMVCDIRGVEYDKHVRYKNANGISQWGRGLWSDLFFFDHAVFDYWDDLHQADKDFINMITSRATMMKTFDLEYPAEFAQPARWYQKALDFIKRVYRTII